MKKLTYLSAMIASVLAVFIFLLRLIGRTFFTDCGWGLWTSDARSHCTSQLFADPYSLTHVLHGVLLFALLWIVVRKLPDCWRFVIAILLEMAWEILENSPFIVDRYRAATASFDYVGDSIQNSLGDVCCAALGFWLVHRYGWKAGLAALLVIELLLLLLIRDNLTLNIIMLIHPVSAIRVWQAGG